MLPTSAGSRTCAIISFSGESTKKALPVDTTISSSDGTFVLFDVPSNVNAAAFSMAIAGSGAVKDFKTTILMTPDEGFDALLLAQGAGYRPPGG